MRVLIAEDDTINRLDLLGLLESNRFEVCGEARDGVEAVKLEAVLEPDAILIGHHDAAPRRDRGRAPHPGAAAGPDRHADRARPARARRSRGRDGRPRLPRDTVWRAGLVPALVAARARHAGFAVERLQPQSLAEALEARKAIERAKGALMAKEGISEEAFARRRRASQRSGRPTKVIADAVAATLGYRRNGRRCASSADRLAVATQTEVSAAP
jgi:response regulator NasT